MKTYKFSDLLSYEIRIKNLYSKLGLSFSPSNRISQYFAYLSRIEQMRKLDDGSFTRLLDEDKSKYYFSLYYVLEIHNILEALENSEHDKKLLREKLIDLAKGTYLLSEETSSNKKARDTSFELALFAFLHSKGLNIKLDDPNPDLKLSSKKFIYNIECKRPFSAKSVEDHIKTAAKQLEKTKGENIIPTIALSLEQILFGNEEDIDFILDSTDQRTALSRLDNTLLAILQEYNSLLGKVLGDRACLVLYYISCLTGLKTEGIMANAAFVTGNVFNFEETLGNSIVEDLYSLIPRNPL